MAGFASRSGLSSAARTTFVAALGVFVYTIVIGILNGTDIWKEPEHDFLMSHVHAGTLGWLTLGVAGIAFLMFSRDRMVSAEETGRANTLAWAMVVSVVLYVAAFAVGDSLFDDWIQRPIFGTLLFAVVIWFFVWMLGANKQYQGKNVSRLGFVLAWISLVFGSLLGVALGLYTANGSVPGLPDETAARFAEAHPPALVVGYLLLASFAIVEWLLLDDRGWTRAGSVQMWLLFAAGVILNFAFIAGLDEELAGPANLLMIVAAFMMLWRSRAMIKPSGWKGADVGKFPRFSVFFLIVYLTLLTILVSWVIGGTVDFDALTESQEGLLLTFDHVMFIGVMTNALFGVLAASLASSPRTNMTNKVLLWGVNIGIIGFGLGLISTTPILKQIFTPIMGLALLYGIWMYWLELRSSATAA